MKPKPVKPILFLNSPVEDIDADIIGMEPYVEQLNAAIDAGAQVIAVTSPFGAGNWKDILSIGYLICNLSPIFAASL